MIVAIDASVWLGAILSSEPQFEATHAWLRDFFSNDGIVAAPSIVMAEVAGAYARRTGRTEIALAYANDLQDDPQVKLFAVDSELGYAAAQVAARLPLKGSDAVYIALAEALNVPLVTRDREQLERGSALVQALTPEEMEL